MNKKYLLIIDLILVLGSLLAVFFTVGYTQPLVIGPLSDSQESLMFVFPASDYLLLDDNIKFDSPQTFFVDDSLNLKSGRYYIKSISGLSSEVREIKSEIDLVLQIRKLQDESLGVFNVGESRLQLETYEVGTLVNSSLVGSGGNE